MTCPLGHGSASGAFSTNPSAISGGGESVVSDLGRKGGTYYPDYLQLGKLLSCQDMLSAKAGSPQHDEHLFIVIHQVYELWFKQIRFELQSVLDLFSGEEVDERKMLQITQRLERICEIEKVLIQQLQVLETMTTLDFMDFREYLVPASGFQSTQFRTVETLLGLRHDNRPLHSQEIFWKHFNEADAESLRETHKQQSLLTLVEKWLERTPGLNDSEFWDRYKKVVRETLAGQREQVESSSHEAESKKSILEECERNERSFESLLSKEKHDEMRSRGDRRLSHSAYIAAIMINLYRDEPRFHLPFRLLTLLMDVDSLLNKWRYQHTLMVQRMIGNKLGTGGSSGYQYLRSTAGDRYRIFIDLFNLSTFLVPRSKIPPLGKDLKDRLATFPAE